jgi:hypothetical protein
MKKLLILGTLLLSSCSAYRIQVTKTKTVTYYTPSKRERLVWFEHYHSFTSKQMAEDKIKEWKEDKAFEKSNKSQYIYFK